jgi:hypothetical protein
LFSLDVIIMIKSRNERWAGHAADMKQKIRGTHF